VKKSILDDVEPNHSFWVVDGTTLKNMQELLSALGEMDEETFKHHVNEEKNDFHNWVRDVHRDEKLAELLAGTFDKEAAASAIKRRINEIQKPTRDGVSGGSKNLRDFSEPDRELGKSPLQNKNDPGQGEKVDTTSMMNMFNTPQKQDDDSEGNKNADNKNIKTLFNTLKDRFYSWKTDRILKSFNYPLGNSPVANEFSDLLKKSKIPFPKPVVSHSIDHRKYEVIVTIVAVIFIISLIGISSQAAQITGAVIGSPQTQEVQFLGLGGVFAVVVLLFAALHAIDKHAKNQV